MNSVSQPPQNPKLPRACHFIVPGWGRGINVGLITQGTPNYRREVGFDWSEGPEAHKVCRMTNAARGITPQQEAAMFGGAFWGWDSREANPDNYDKDGKPLVELRTLDW